MGNKITVVGSSNTDMILKMDHIPKPGETIIGGNFSTASGGKGANQAVGAARAGGDVKFVARTGTDMFGDKAVEGFQKDNIDVTYVIRDAGAPSGVALIFVDEKGENSIGVASGANGNLSPEDIQNASDAITSADIVAMQLEIPIETVEAAAKLAHANGVKVVLDPAPAQPLSDELLKCVSIVTPNETEAEMLTGQKVESEADAEAAAQILFDKGVETVLITLGSKGVFIFNGESKTMIPGFKVDAVDSTAAGDVFAGALSVALAEGKTLQDAVRFANAAGALSVTKLGAQPSAPTRTEIEAFLQQNA